MSRIFLSLLCRRDFASSLGLQLSSFFTMFSVIQCGNMSRVISSRFQKNWHGCKLHLMGFILTVHLNRESLILSCFFILRYFETFDMVSEESCATQLEWKEAIAKCETDHEIGICLSCMFEYSVLELVLSIPFITFQFLSVIRLSFPL